jgi:methylisocitrate lyase
LVTPSAYDAFTVRIIERLGFKAFALGGSTMLAARYGLPDLGLAALGEMVETARDIIAATDLPCIMDGDDGYGDVKSVVRMMRIYEDMGVGAVVIEDQIREAKQPGETKARGVVAIDVISQKLRAAVETRTNKDTMVIARCDAYGLEGLDACFRRCDAYLNVGVDGIFITGISSVEDLVRVGRTYKTTYTIANMIEGGALWLKPSELADLGFSQVVYPNFVMLRAMLAVESALKELQEFANGRAEPKILSDVGGARNTFRELVREPEWANLEKRFQRI